MSTHPTREDVSADSGIDGPWWVACAYPERPDDDWTVWLWSCDSCMRHLMVAAALSPAKAAARPLGDGRRSSASLACSLDRAREWRVENGLSEIPR